MSKKRIDYDLEAVGLLESDLNLSEFKAEDYLSSKVSINAYIAEAIKSGDPRLIAMAEQTIKRAQRKWKI